MKKSKKLILHIGCEKTGTTTIQRTLANNRKRLREGGYCYSTVLGQTNHFALPIYCLDDSRVTPLRASRGLKDEASIASYREQIHCDFRKEVKANASRTFILSSEQLSSTVTSKSELLRLSGWLKTFFEEVSVVVYLRRQDSMYLSSYSTLLKSGATKSLDVGSVDSASIKYNFKRLLDLWSSVFKNIEVGVFDREFLKNSCAVDDFCARAGIHVDNLEKVRNQNGSLSRKTAEFMRLVNHYLPSIGGEKNVRGNLQDLIHGVSIQGGKLDLTPAQRSQLMGVFEESNRYVYENYLKCDFQKNPLAYQALADSSTESSDSDGLSVDEMARIFSEIWQMKQDQVLDLINRKS